MNIKIGDRIRFRSQTRFSNAAAVRKVKRIDQRGFIIVRFAGWSDFIVYPSEVLEIVA